MSQNAIINFLRNIPLFKNLGPVIISRLAENSGTLKFDKGETVQEEGKPCSNLYIAVSGAFEVFKKIDDERDVILNTIKRGELFGEHCLLKDMPSLAGLRAAEDSILIFINRNTLNLLIKESPDFCRSFISHLTNLNYEAMAKEYNLINFVLDNGLDLPNMYILKNGGAGEQDEENEQAAVMEVISNNIAREEADDIPDSDVDDIFYRKEFTCPMCANKFSTLKPRQKYVVVEKTDDDFCSYYKTVNPLFYEINVCPVCCYAFNNSSYGPIRAEIKDGMAKLLLKISKPVNYCNTRSLQDALDTFMMAVECQRLRGADDAVIGRLYLKTGWMFRYMEQKDLEMKFLDKALYYITRSFEKNPSDDPKEEMNLMFLLGQLHFILGDEKGAINWFIRITQHPGKKAYPYMVNRARDKWQEIRRNK
ncbi:MAG: DUF2225 domain-containing protein [Bacillota bacterium]